METTTSEHIIGGFLSNGLIYKTKKSYAIYVTNKRLIGLESPRNPIYPFIAFIIGWVLGSFLVGSIFFGLLDGLILGLTVYILLGALSYLGDITPGKELIPSYEQKVLRELEKRKDISIPIENIASIELKSPLKQVPGHLRVTTKTGRHIEITISFSKDFERLKTILKAFYPDLILTK